MSIVFVQFFKLCFKFVSLNFILLFQFEFDGFIVWGKQKTTKQTNGFGTEAVLFFLVSLQDLLIMF
jgi:hypothetical protein